MYTNKIKGGISIPPIPRPSHKCPLNNPAISTKLSLTIFRYYCFKNTILLGQLTIYYKLYKWSKQKKGTSPNIIARRLRFKWISSTEDTQTCKRKEDRRQVAKITDNS